jgi:hypothetical protein
LGQRAGGGKIGWQNYRGEINQNNRLDARIILPIFQRAH